MPLLDITRDVLLTEEGAYLRKTILTPIEINPILSEYAETSLSMITPNMRDGIRFVITKDLIIGIRRLFSLPFRCHMTFDADAKKYTPVFGTGEGPNAFVLPSNLGLPEFRFVFPDNMATLLLIPFTHTFGAYGDMHLLSAMPSLGRTDAPTCPWSLYHPPMPNIYSDGRLCVGDEVQDNRASLPTWMTADPTRDMVDAFDYLQDSWFSAAWNGDLLGNGISNIDTLCKEVLQFDATTMQNVPVASDYRWGDLLFLSVPEHERVAEAAHLYLEGIL